MALGAGVAVALCVLAKRDRDQQARIDAMARNIAALNDSVHAATLSACPQNPAQIDSAQVAALQRTLIAAMPAAVASVAAVVPAAAPAASPSPPQRTAEQEAALARANDLVDTALQRKTITRADVASIRRELAAAGASDEAGQLRSRIAAAVNARQLVPDGPHFLP
jgi:hypothetical protein